MFFEKLLRVLPPCLIHKYTGYYCPGCGATRSLLFLLTGHPLRSLFYYPAIPLATLLFIWLLVSFVAEKLVKHRVFFHFPLTVKWVYLILTVILGNCVWKNAVLYWTGIPLIP